MRSSELTSMVSATPIKKIALVKPPKTSIFQVPKAKRGSLAYFRAAA